MAIAREDLHIGGKCLLKTRLSAPGGAAVSFKTRPVVVREVLRAAIIAQLEDGSRRTIPFTELEADREYLAERAQKQAEKKEAMRRDAQRVVEPLKFNLGDKLMHDNDGEDAAPAVSSAVREAAKKQIEALKAAPQDGMSALERERRAAVALFQEAIAKGASKREAAEQVGQPVTTLHTWTTMIERGLPLNRTRGKRPGSRNTPREVRDKAVAMARAGRPLIDIARELGIAHASMIGRWRDRADAAMPQPEVPAPAAPPPAPEPPPPAAPAPGVIPPLPAAPPPAVEDERDRELRELRAENARLQAKVKRLLSMVEDL